MKSLNQEIVLLIGVAMICSGHIVEMLERLRLGVPAAVASQKATIREMQFPDTWVIIPCSVRLKNGHWVVGTRVRSAS